MLSYFFNSKLSMISMLANKLYDKMMFSNKSDTRNILELIHNKVRRKPGFWSQ